MLHKSKTKTVIGDLDQSYHGRPEEGSPVTMTPPGQKAVLEGTPPVGHERKVKSHEIMVGWWFQPYPSEK